MNDIGLPLIGLLALAVVIPVAGFIMTMLHARRGDTWKEQRWRKRHGLLFWVAIPTVCGSMTLLGYADLLPRVFSLIGVVALGGTTFLSWSMQQRHNED